MTFRFDNYRIILVAVLLLVFGSCSKEPKRVLVPVMPSQTIRVYDAPYDRVWGVLVSLLEKREEIDLEIVDKEAGAIITDFIHIEPDSPLGKEVIYPGKGEPVIESAKYDMTIAVKDEGEEESEK